MPLNVLTPDKCCTKHMALALYEGALETATVWTCPACGIDWRAEMVGDVKSWTPAPWVEVIR